MKRIALVLCAAFAAVPARRAATQEALEVAVVAEESAPPAERAAIELFRVAGMHVVPFAVDPDGTGARVDVLVVPGPDRDDPALVKSLAASSADARFVIAFGAGVRTLARAGVLARRFCTTSRDDTAVRALAPGIHVVEAVSFTLDDRVVTSGGGARAPEAALYVIERLRGETPARDAARSLGLDWRLARVRTFIAQDVPPRCYRPEDRIDASTSVTDASGAEHRVLELAGTGDRVLVLTIFGGGGQSAESDGRGGLWCEDSQNEMTLLRHARARFEGKGVAFIGVACPPVRHAERFGFAKDAFASASPVNHAELAKFVAATEQAAARGAIAFKPVWFDPRFRLLGSTLTEPEAERPAWEGRFKAVARDDQYGTPTTWVLGRDGAVLIPPFAGNAYESGAELTYSSREFEEGIERALELTAR